MQETGRIEQGLGRGLAGTRQESGRLAGRYQTITRQEPSRDEAGSEQEPRREQAGDRQGPGGNQARTIQGHSECQH